MRCFAAAGAVAVAFGVSHADAYTVGTPVTAGCHELITTTALLSARAASPAAAPLPLMTSDDQAMVDDLPFSIDDSMRDLGGVSLLLGMRDNDLKGLSPTDLAALAIVQSDPSTQQEHCLRSLADVEPNGTPDALAQCRSYILAQVTSALGYLTAAGTPDPNARVGLAVGLAIRGPVTVPLPGFYVYMGHAIHAIEDSVSHSYRDADGGVTASLTWLHVVDNDLNEAVDGPPHSAGLDECTSLDALRGARLTMATVAAEELLLAALGPGTADARLANAGAVLDQVLAFHPGCTAANGWCDAPERAYPIELTSCSLSRAGGGLCGAVVLLALGALLYRRRRRAAACVGVVLVTASARASADVAPAAPDEPLPRSRFGAYAAIGGSLDHTAFSGSVAGRLLLDPRWLVGMDVEINPWFSVLGGGGVRPGALNVYATGVRRWGIHSERFDLRTTAHLGSSTILFDLFGVPKYTTGIYAGANLLGVEWRALRTLSVVLDPADVAFPIPQLHATPFGYLQYRITIGLQWGA
jgi:hypothetical protein